MRRETVRDASGLEPWKEVVSTFAAYGALSEQSVVNRDGSSIHSLFNLAGASAA